jgi:glycosyltransferase involved in cell wall biosynthesis
MGVLRLIRVLCFSPLFPPSANSEAFCSAKMVLALLARGLDVEVIRLAQIGKQTAADYSEQWRSLGCRTRSVETLEGRRTLILLPLALKYRTISGLRWIHGSIRTARQLHKATPFNVVYSRSMPWIAHVAGFWAARILGVPWIANINDPWDVHHFPEARDFQKRDLHRKDADVWLRRTMSKADLVTFPCERLSQYTQIAAPRDGPIAILPHIGAESEASPSTKEFHLVHAGKVGTGEITGRSCESLLRALAMLVAECPEARSVTRLTFVGREDPDVTQLAGELGISSLVHSVGRVSYDQSLGYIRQAMVCVLIEADMKNGIYLPSKLSDYVCAGVPVLALSPREGTVADLASNAGILVVPPNDVAQIYQALLLLFRAYSAGSLKKFAPSPALLHMFSGGALADQFASLASRCLDK